MSKTIKGTLLGVLLAAFAVWCANELLRVRAHHA